MRALLCFRYSTQTDWHTFYEQLYCSVCLLYLSVTLTPTRKHTHVCCFNCVESSLTFANISTNASISVDAGFRLFATYANSINASPPLPNASHAIVSSTSSCVFSNLFLASLLKSPPVPQSNSLMSPMGELPLVMPPSQSPHCQNPVRMQNSIEAYMDDINPVCGLASNALSQQNPWGCFAFPSSLLEVLAMTSEIDTLSLTAKVKDMLQFHNLGQKLFGEVILGLSQGSVSELLSKPKPWHMLSIKGREPFIKMNLWLERAQSVEQLKSYQSLMKGKLYACLPVTWLLWLVACCLSCCCCCYCYDYHNVPILYSTMTTIWLAWKFLLLTCQISLAHIHFSFPMKIHLLHNMF